jgi:hypothetical protein
VAQETKPVNQKRSRTLFHQIEQKIDGRTKFWKQGTLRR